MLSNKIIKQEIDIELKFIFEIKLQDERFLAKYHQLFSY